MQISQIVLFYWLLQRTFEVNDGQVSSYSIEALTELFTKAATSEAKLYKHQEEKWQKDTSIGTMNGSARKSILYDQ